MQKLINDSLGHRLDALPLFFRQVVAQGGKGPFQLRLGDLLRPGAQPGNHRDAVAKGPVAKEASDFLGDHHLRLGGLGAAHRAVVRHHPLDIVHVVGVDTLELVDVWSNVPRNRQIHHEKWPVSSGFEHHRQGLLGQQRCRGGDRAKHHVGSHQERGELLEGPGSGADGLGERIGPLEGSVRHHHVGGAGSA